MHFNPQGNNIYQKLLLLLSKQSCQFPHKQLFFHNCLYYLHFIILGTKIFHLLCVPVLYFKGHQDGVLLNFEIYYCHNLRFFYQILKTDCMQNLNSIGLIVTEITDWFLKNPEVHYRPYISPPSVPILRKINLISSITTHLPQIHLMLSSHLRLGLLKGLFPSCLPTKPLYKFLDSSTRASSPAHLSHLDLSILILCYAENNGKLQHLFNPS